MTTSAPMFAEHWRREIYDQAIRRGMPSDTAQLIAENVENAAFAPAQADEAWDVWTACKVVGAAKLANEAIRSRMPLQRVEDTLRAALPRRGVTLEPGGLKQARFAFVAAGIVPRYVDSPSAFWRSAR